MAAFVLESPCGELSIPALATGTKSIGRDKMNKEGFVLNDCHAEVLARRSLIRNVFREISSGKLMTVSKDLETGRYKLAGKLHLYVTEPPCGDASMIENHWTGAKPLDKSASGLSSGAFRLKSGRSDLPP